MSNFLIELWNIQWDALKMYQDFLIQLMPDFKELWSLKGITWTNTEKKRVNNGTSKKKPSKNRQIALSSGWKNSEDV